MANTTLKVMKAKTDRDGKKTYYQIGTAVIRDGGEKGGVLFLNFLDGDFPMFVKDPKEVASE